MKATGSYHLHHHFDALIHKIRQCASTGVTELTGALKFTGVSDFRLNFGRYRVVELAPMATRIGVFMEWRKIFHHSELYADDPNFYEFEDAFGYLGVNDNWNQPWNVYAQTDLSDPYVETFLKTGMRLMVKEINRQHPETKKPDKKTRIVTSRRQPE